jgi:hypothetical protein
LYAPSSAAATPLPMTPLAPMTSATFDMLQSGLLFGHPGYVCTVEFSKGPLQLHKRVWHTHVQHVCSRRTDTFAIVKFCKLGHMYTQDWGHCAQSRITALVAVLGPRCTHSHACASHAAAAAYCCSLCGVSGLQALRSYLGTPELPASFPPSRRQRGE